MSEKIKAQRSEHAAENGPSLDRRRLLKASAFAAPIIATLPSGAAMANASASACIIKDFNNTHGSGLAGYRSSAEGPDQYLRVPAKLYSARKTGSSQTVYEVNGELYDAAGNPFDPTGWGLRERGTGYALRVFVPYNDATNEIDSMTPSDVENANPGYWPPNMLDQDTHMALTGSCLCSVNPDDTCVW